MDVAKAVLGYLARVLAGVDGLKVLLLDEHTTPVISTALTQSALLAEHVYLTDRVDSTARQRMPHLACLALLRPTAESIGALAAELREPRYAHYHLFFTNVVPRAAIEALAEADVHAVVRDVQECFADYVPLTPSHFTLDASVPPARLWARTALADGGPAAAARQAAGNASYLDTWHPDDLQRHVMGLVAALLSVRRRPVVRYERMSGMARTLAAELQRHVGAPPHVAAGVPAPAQPEPASARSLFDTLPAPHDAGTLLLILDRRNDPVTPLLTQWTYQAMVHEQLGIQHGRVALPSDAAAGAGAGAEAEAAGAGVADARAPRQVVLSAETDPFFGAHMYANFGDLGALIKRYVEEYQSRTAHNARIETIADMKKFIEDYPQFRKLGGNVSKHVAILAELSRQVEARRLLQVSELEQSLASVESHGADVQAVREMIDGPIDPEAKLRLAILYALRYQRHGGNQIKAVAQQLKDNGLSEEQVSLIWVTLAIAGASKRQDDLFSNEGLFSRGKSALKGLKGVENVYTQHTPHLLRTIESLDRARLKETSYPRAGSDPYAPYQGPSSGSQLQAGEFGSVPRPREVILFIIGGSTYEEARTVALLNAQMAQGAAGLGTQAGSGSSTPTPALGPGTAPARVLLGGTTVLNSRAFLSMLGDAAYGPQPAFPSGVLRPSGASLGPAPNQGPLSANTLVDDPRALIAPDRLVDAADGAKSIARGLFENLRKGVEGFSQL